MMMMMAILTFGGALGLAAYAMAVTLTPRMGQIVEILFGGSPTTQYIPVFVERRMTVRRREVSVSRGSYRPREAA